MRLHIQKNKVSQLPARPLLLYDGGCGFCLRWAKRLHAFVRQEIDYAPYQDNTKRFPEIPEETMRQYVQFIDISGTAYSGAAAAYKAMAHRKGFSGPLWLYQKFLPFAWISDRAYDMVSRNRHRL